MKLLPVYILFIVLVLMAGCAKPPEVEMQNAVEAVFRAENDPNAALYASGTLMRAKTALQQMHAESDHKRYDAAKTYALEAITLAERAIQEGQTGASRIVEESSSLIGDLRQEIEETQRNVNGARYSRLDLDYNQLDKEIVNALELADRVEANQASGNYQEALQGAKELRADLASINQRVAGAVVIKKK